MRLTKVFNNFFKSEKSIGIALLTCTVVSLIISNSFLSENYQSLWAYKIFGHDLSWWINDGLMVIFFFYIGLELQREVYAGELNNPNKASLPIIAALGGMLIPAGIYMLINAGTDKLSGAGIPMATDIAFATGIISLSGKRVPNSLKVFLTALAVIDDLGAILVIAIFYTQSISIIYLLLALSVFGVMLLLNRLRIRIPILYIAGGLLLWYFMHDSGVHSTIAGVLAAFTIPFKQYGRKRSLSITLEEKLHKPVSFLILPLFALANTSIVIGTDITDNLFSTFSIGIFAGLVLGKPLGIALFSFISVKYGLSRLSEDINFKHIIGAGCLAGIGFTMSIFITLLAFENQEEIINASKLMILISSTVAGLIGYFWLKAVLKKKHPVKLES